MSTIAKVVLCAGLGVLFVPPAVIFLAALYRALQRWPEGRKAVGYAPPGEAEAELTAPVLYHGLALKSQKVDTLALSEWREKTTWLRRLKTRELSRSEEA